MVTPLYTIAWTKRAQIHLRQLYDYISKDSKVNAKNVVSDLITAVAKASRNPELYPPDKFKKDNDDSYRSFELHRYRVSYRVKDGEIVVLRVRHTSREPKEF